MRNLFLGAIFLVNRASAVSLWCSVTLISSKLDGGFGGKLVVL